MKRMVDLMNRASKIIALLKERVRLSPAHRRFFYLTFGILWFSGALWLVAEWFKDPELGPTRTPLQSQSMKIHGAAMLVYLAMLGTLWTHIQRGFALQANRLSGSAVVAVNAVLSVSGWILYYLGDDRVRDWSSLAHWIIGLAVLPLLIGHILLGRAQTSALLGHNKNQSDSRSSLNPSENDGE
jgi:hypothetical protein